MYYLIAKDHRPAHNLALEEYLFDNFIEMGLEDIVLFYVNKPSYICGKSQNIYREVDWLKLQAKGVPCLRRISGGGTVYHDLHNLNFSFMTRHQPDYVKNFAYFLEPIRSYLAELGLKADLVAPSHLFVEGKKISGNAQAIRHDRILHHGTLLYDADLAALDGLLSEAPPYMSTKAVASLPNPVINLADLFQPQGLKLSLSQFQQGLLDYICGAKVKEQGCGPAKELKLAPETYQAIDLLVEQKYKLWSWNFARSANFSFNQRPLRLNFEGQEHLGKIDLTVKRGCIESLDFFGSDNDLRLSAYLSDLLGGLRLDYTELDSFGQDKADLLLQIWRQLFPGKS